MSIALIGFPWDRASSYARGAALGPAVLRAALFADSSNVYARNGVDARAAIAMEDFAPLPDEPAAARAAIEARVVAALDAAQTPLSLGGDHSVTHPILRAIAARRGPVNILHIDAHTDLYDAFEGDRHSHACPFARAFEDGLVGRLVQVGLRSIGPAERAFGEARGVMMLEADETDRIPYEALVDPLYVTIDLDGFDPAFAPGVSHPEPGGLSARDGFSILKRLQVRPVGADIVEFNPERDVAMATARLGSRLAKELIGVMMAKGG